MTIVLNPDAWAWRMRRSTTTTAPIDKPGTPANPQK